MEDPVVSHVEGVVVAILKISCLSFFGIHKRFLPVPGSTWYISCLCIWNLASYCSFLAVLLDLDRAVRLWRAEPAAEFALSAFFNFSHIAFHSCSLYALSSRALNNFDSLTAVATYACVTSAAVAIVRGWLCVASMRDSASRMTWSWPALCLIAMLNCDRYVLARISRRFSLSTLKDDSLVYFAMFAMALWSVHTTVVKSDAWTIW